VHVDVELGCLEGGGLRGQLGGLLLVVEGLGDLPPERPEPLLPLGTQRLGHLSVAAATRRQGRGARVLEPAKQREEAKAAYFGSCRDELPYYLAPSLFSF
jgi:hypothetical protein